MKTYHIITIGCQMNKSDSERMAGHLETLGYKWSDNKYWADLVVVNTCGVRQSAEDRVYGIIPRIKKENPAVKIILAGCLSERKDVQQRLKNNVDIWLPIKKLPKLEKVLTSKGVDFYDDDYLKIKPKYQSKFSAFVPIGNGCNNFCSYCVVPYARGREVYRPVEDIINEVQNLVKNGHKEIVLIAQNVNSYKYNANAANDMRMLRIANNANKNRNNGFAQLLRMVNDIDGDFWIRFVTSHPKDVSDELIKIVAECSKVCEHIHLPVQSGDNKVLKAMNRNYTVEHYRILIKKIRQAIPGASITTDVIVGFPGEAREQFNNTVKLFKEMKFDLAYIAQYSPRPDTAAAKLKDTVSREEKKKREAELMKILRKTALENNKKYIGRIVKILVGGINKKGEWYGRTRTNKNVKITGTKKQENPKAEQARYGAGKKARKQESKKINLAGKFVRVKIIKAQDFGLEGKLIMNDKKPANKIIAIVGTNASGKTGLGVKLAAKFNGEIVSADSRQVYKGLDVGTGKDLNEYQVGKKRISYHLIDVVGPKEEFNLAKYQRLAFRAIDDILRRGKLPIIVGGTGLYVQAIVDGYKLSSAQPDKKLRARLEKLDVDKLFKKLQKLNFDFANRLNDSDKKNKRRLIRYIEICKTRMTANLDTNDRESGKQLKCYNALVIGLTWPKQVLHKRIYKRLVERLEKKDMIREVGGLHEIGVSWQRLEGFGLEYKFIAQHLQDKLDYEEMKEKLFRAIKQFAKKQITWLKRWERQGAKINWVKSRGEAERWVREFLK